MNLVVRSVGAEHGVLQVGRNKDGYIQSVQMLGCCKDAQIVTLQQALAFHSAVMITAGYR